MSRAMKDLVDDALVQDGVKAPRARSDAAIVVRDVSKSYGDVRALQGVSLRVEPGTVLGLLGPNGAGKTTLAKILTTLLRPDAGEAVVAGLDVVRDARRLRHIIGFAGQYAAVDETLTGRENLVMVGRLYHLSSSESRRRAADLLAEFDLTDAADRPVKTYSGGMRRRLDLAASLVIKPRVLFLDEPTTGLDPRSRLELWRVIEELVSQGVTMLLTTQYLEEADRLADRIVVIDQGRIIAEGTAEDLKRRVGGDVIEVRLEHARRTREAVAALAAIVPPPTQVDEAVGRIRVPATQGAGGMAGIVRRLDDAGIAIADLALHRPTLDDVFLKLTGKTAAESERGASIARSDETGAHREGGDAS